MATSTKQNGDDKTSTTQPSKSTFKKSRANLSQVPKNNASNNFSNAQLKEPRFHSRNKLCLWVFRLNV